MGARCQACDELIKPTNDIGTGRDSSWIPVERFRTMFASKLVMADTHASGDSSNECDKLRRAAHVHATRDTTMKRMNEVQSLLALALSHCDVATLAKVRNATLCYICRSVRWLVDAGVQALNVVHLRTYEGGFCVLEEHTYRYCFHLQCRDSSGRQRYLNK